MVRKRAKRKTAAGSSSNVAGFVENPDKGPLHLNDKELNSVTRVTSYQETSSNDIEHYIEAKNPEKINMVHLRKY